MNQKAKLNKTINRVISLTLTILLSFVCVDVKLLDNCFDVYAQTQTSYIIPTGITAEYNDTLRWVEIKNPEGNPPGTWEWMSPYEKITEIGIQTFLAKFTPADPTYKPVTNIAIEVNVEKKTPFLFDNPTVWASKGDRLSDIELGNWDDSTAGIWSWMDETIIIEDYGEHIYKAKFVPVNPNYKTLENLDVTVIIEKPEPPVPSGLTASYGQTLADVSFETFNAACKGVWNWETPDQSVGGLGNKRFYASFAADSDSPYKSENNILITITVERGVPLYIVPTGITAIFGQKLSELTLNNPAGSDSGSWSWMYPEQLVGSLGTNMHKAKFVPESSYCKSVENIDIPVLVTKKMPICDAPQTLTAGINQRLSEVNIPNPDGNTEGTWEWMDDMQSVGNAGVKSFKARFIPKDNNYETVSDINIAVCVEIGTEAHPYIINTKEELDNVRNNLNASYKLNADIEFTEADFAEGGEFYNDGKGWEPIGSYSKPFSGTFDGNGHVIRNLQCVNSAAGLFGYSSGTVKRLGMVDCNFEGSSAGSICYVNDGKISECYNTGKVKAEASYECYAGGIANINYGTIENCYNSGNVGKVYANSDSRTGGIVGWNRNGGKISNCYNVGNVVCAYWRGEIVGYCDDSATVENCYYLNYGHKACGNRDDETGVLSLEQMKSQESYVGFDFDSTWSIDLSADYWMPTLKNVANYAGTLKENTTDYAGGYGTYDSPYLIKTTQQLSNIRKNLWASYRLEDDIVFKTADFSKKGSFYNEGKRWEPIGTKDEPFCGNFDGNGHCISNIIVNRPDETFCGLFSYSYGEIKNLRILDFNITGRYTCAGMVGCNYGFISNCSNHGEINIFEPDSEAYPMFYGTICGYNEGVISRCFNTANIYSADFNRGDSFAFGGIVLRNDSENGRGGIITECYNSGNITTTKGEAGGIVNTNYSGTIIDCYNSGKIKAYQEAGGIAAFSHRGTISNCYNVGMAISEYDKEKMAGIVSTNGENTLINCYYLDSNEYYNEDSKYGTVCTISKMLKKSTYQGFDFDTIWEFNKDGNYGLPTLRGMENYATAPTENTSEFAGGYGTKSSPYIIKTKAQMNNIRKELDACFRLGADISFSAGDFASEGTFYNNGKGWEPLGNEDAMFKGTFNGNGHIIDGLKINRREEPNVGLFGRADGNIRNLKIADATINGGGIVGGIIGYMECGNVSNCEVQGTIGVYRNENNSYENAVGGIIGKAYRTCYIKNCINRAQIVSDKELSSTSTGGIVGEASYSKITGSQNYGTIQCNSGYGYAGGIAGESRTVDECFNAGNIVGTVESGIDAGGIAGKSYIIKNSYNVGTVISKATAGGICGSASTVSSCYNAGNVSVISAGEADEWSDGYAGGIAGENAYNIDNCYNTGVVKSNRGSSGGIAGSASNSSSTYIKQCYNIGNVSCDSGNTGAILGKGSVTIANCFYLDNVSKGVGSGTDTATQYTAEQLQNAGTYGDAFDFNYDMIWSISDTAEYKFPILTEVVNPELQYTLSAGARQGMAETPTAESYGNGKITVRAISGQKYVCVQDTDKDNSGEIPAFSSSEWKSASGSTLVFSGLTQGKTYRVYTYIPAVGGQSASYISQPLVVTLKAVGDLSGDGKIDSSDALYLRRALAGWDGYKLNFSAGDVNADGKLSADDIMVLERHVAGWKGYEQLPYKA